MFVFNGIHWWVQNIIIGKNICSKAHKFTRKRISFFHIDWWRRYQIAMHMNKDNFFVFCFLSSNSQFIFLKYWFSFISISHSYRSYCEIDFFCVWTYCDIWFLYEQNSWEKSFMWTARLPLSHSLRK